MALVSDLPKRATYTGVVPANGILEIPIKVISGREAWRVEQVTIDMASAPAGSTAAMLLNGNLVTPMIPAGDAAGGDPPVPLLLGDILTIRWTGATPGARGNVLVIYTAASYS